MQKIPVKSNTSFTICRREFPFAQITAEKWKRSKASSSSNEGSKGVVAPGRTNRRRSRRIKTGGRMEESFHWRGARNWNETQPIILAAEIYGDPRVEILTDRRRNEVSELGFRRSAGVNPVDRTLFSWTRPFHLVIIRYQSFFPETSWQMYSTYSST